MRRRLFTLASAVSLLICAAVAVLWVCSYSDNPLEISRFGADLESPKTARYWHFHLGAHDGGFFWMRCAIPISPGVREWAMVGKREWHHGEILYGGIDSLPHSRAGQCVPPQEGDCLAPGGKLLGFRAFQITDYGVRGSVVVVPDWFLFICFAGPPTIWLRRRIRMRKYQIDGRCSACGYNLTGNTSGACPECGRVIQGNEEAKTSRMTCRLFRIAWAVSLLLSVTTGVLLLSGYGVGNTWVVEPGELKVAVAFIIFVALTISAYVASRPPRPST